jgi:hypothetical protein
MFAFHKPKKKKPGGIVPGFKGHARADRASRDEFNPAVRRAHGQLGKPQEHPIDGDEPRIWDADEDERARAHSGSDLLPYSSAAARASRRRNHHDMLSPNMRQLRKATIAASRYITSSIT